MAELRLNAESSVEEIKTLLEANLNLTNSFLPIVDPIPIIKNKGIYFWVMKKEGYKVLSKYVEIGPIDNVIIFKRGWISYDLIYIGTTGTGKEGKSNLTERLKWHITQKHNESAINRKESTLSTLRTGLGALLAKDLIEDDTEKIVNEFMEKYMAVYWIEYTDNVSLIKKDEGKLISTIKPLLNIIHNSNTYVAATINPSRIYRIRRNQIEASTKIRLSKNANSNSKITVKTQKSRNKMKNKILNNHHIASFEDASCVEIPVNIKQSISKAIENFSNTLPNPCKFIIYDSKDSNNFVYKSNRTGGWRSTGNGRVQNIYNYFDRTDKDYSMNNGFVSIYRNDIIKEEMKKYGIENIVIKVCPNIK